MKLIYTVEVSEATDTETAIDYLARVQSAFTAIMDLNAFGFTDDEAFATSIVEFEDPSHTVKG